MDVLSDVLSKLRLKGSIFLNAEFQAPWGMDIPKDKMAILHIITFGSCWLKLPGDPNFLSLNSGDLVLLPRGDAHSLMHAASSNTIPAAEILAVGTLIEDGPFKYGGRGEVTNFLCGRFDYDWRIRHPLFETLPDVMHITGSHLKEFSWLASAHDLLQNEANSHNLGSSAVLDRLSEVIFSQILRVYIQKTPLQKGFLLALKDKTLMKALKLMHNTSNTKWTLAELARECGVSRSFLAERFKHVMGETPMNYLTRWRIQKAQELLQDSQYSVAQIAEEVGYQAESAFSTVFKKVCGRSPGQYRREIQVSS